MALPPIFIEFLGSYTGLAVAADGVKTELAEVDAEGTASMEGLGAVSTGILLGIGAAAVGAAYEGVKLATSFQQAMTMISTQAGVPRAQIAALSNDVLNLAGQVGFSPDSLAEALYHIESSFASVGITSSQAMSLLKTAAQGAAVGGADLTDVTNALDAAVASGIPGVQNFSQAMGALNAIVGAGDMTMQDLANAMSTGVLAVVKGYGLSLTDVGAALAVFGDNNIRGAVAATDLRMAVQAMQTPMATAGPTLAQLGLSADTLANVMEHGGLLPALEELSARMTKAGVNGDKMSQTLTELYGKKAGSGLDVLIGQLSRVQSKYPAIEQAANSFASAVVQQNNTLQQHINDAKAALDSLGIRIGDALLPPLTRFMGEMSKGLAYLAAHTGVFWGMVAGLGALTTALIGIKIATFDWVAVLKILPTIGIISAIVALGVGIYYAYTHIKSFRDAMNDLGRVLERAWKAFDDGVLKSKTFRDAMRDIGIDLKKLWKDFDDGVLKSKTFRNAMTAIGHAFKDVGHALESKTFHNAVVDIMHSLEDAWKWFDKTVIKSKWLADGVKLYVKLMEYQFRTSWHDIGAVIKWFENGPLKDIRSEIANFEKFWKAHGQEIEQDTRAVWGLISAESEFYMRYMVAAVKLGLAVLLDVWRVVWGLIRDFVRLVWDLIGGIIKTAIDFILNIISVFLDLTHGKWSQLGKDTLKMFGQLISDVVHLLNQFSADALRLLWDAGANIVKGLVNGIESGFGAIGNVMKAAGNLTKSEFHDVMGIFSPSRVMYQSGTYVTAGVVNAIVDGYPQLIAAAKGMGAAIKSGVSDLGSSVRLGQLNVSAPSLGTSAASGGNVTQNVVQLSVQGHVLTDQDLRDLIQQELLRLDGRNTGAYLTAKI